MRILVLSWEYPPYMVGGLGKHVAGLIPALGELQEHYGPLHLDILTTRYAGGAPVERLNECVTIHRLETDLFDPANMYNTVIDNNHHFVDYANQLAQDEPFDLIHVHDWLLGVAGVRLKYEHKIPLLVTMHATERGRHQGHVTNHDSSRINGLEGQLCHEAWRVIVCSHFMTTELHNYFGTPFDKLVVIPNGIDQDRLYICPTHKQIELRAQFAPNGEQLLFFVGRIVHEKGLHVLLRAMPGILRAFPDTRLLVAGRNSRHLYPLTRELGVDSAVQFLDYVTDQQRDWLYQVVDSAVFPSLYEPFGIVALEAMALDCNVIASDVGGLGEVVKHEVNGLTVYPDDPPSIVWAVRRLFNDPGAAAVRRLQAHAQVSQQYSWHTIAQQTATLYRSIIAERKVAIW
ncbi:MAG: glycosyltransferase family 4 protein [Caldilineaceae bacterium]|nr:glycosyltransferase family 4 protein [Caldilineaceae bacterium]